MLFALAKCADPFDFAQGRDDECYLRRRSNSSSVEMTSVTWLGGGTAAPFVVSDDAHLSEVWGSIGV